MWRLAVLAGVSACYAPQFERCTVRCTIGEACPADLQCGTDHHCHEASDPATCPVDKFTLTVNPASSGMGLVTGMPQINCPTSCTETVDFGTVVDLSATAASGSRFVSWGGACSGTMICSVKVDADKTVDANFALQERLTVELMGTATGDVASISPMDLGFDCPSANAPCTTDVDQGTTVTLMATPDPGAALTGWDGACAGTSGVSCTLVLSGPLTAIAIFD
jgi:hypothetical protein